jgi:hypothetical protein
MLVMDGCVEEEIRYHEVNLQCNIEADEAYITYSCPILIVCESFFYLCYMNEKLSYHFPSAFNPTLQYFMRCISTS